jgi:hypothetical protein
MWLVVALVVSAVLATGAAGAGGGAPWVTVTTDFESPLFGLNDAPGKGLLVADAGAGPTLVRGGETTLIAPLPGVNDVLQIGNDEYVATVSGPPFALYRISGGAATLVADLGAFEAAVNPDGGVIESNPFDLARIGSKTFVADAAGNSIVVVDAAGDIDWVAAWPPMGPEAVPTSVAVGKDGYLYVGELTGVPATPGTSRVWRIDPDARHARCGSSAGCTLVNTPPFTSIIDITFARNGIAYVTELDEAGWLAMEMGQGVGGTVNACKVRRTGWSCREHATQLPIPTAVAIEGRKVYATLFALVPGQAQVALLPHHNENEADEG